MRLVIAFGVAITLLACGDDSTEGAPDGAPTEDASLDAAVPVEVMPPEAPQPPATPVFTPCPAGWRETTTAAGATYCLPAAARECSGATAQPPSEATCVRVGAACPSGEFSDEEATLYVAMTGSDEAAGDLDHPLATIAEALTRARDGDVVSIGKGRFTGRFEIANDVTLFGACAAETTLDGEGSNGALATTRGASATLRDMTLRDSRQLLSSSLGGGWTVDGVVLEDFAGSAIVIANGDLTIVDSLIRDGAADALRAIDCTTSRCLIEHTQIIRVPGGGVSSTGGSLIARDVDFTDITDNATPATAILAVGRASVDVERAAFTRVGDAAYAINSDISLTDARVEESVGFAVAAGGNSEIELRRASFARTLSGSSLALRDSAHMSASDVLFEETPTLGVETLTTGDGSFDIDRAWFENMALTAVAVIGTFRGSDLTIIGSAATEAASSAGMSFSEGEVFLDRVDVSRYQVTGLFVGEGGTLSGRDLFIHDAMPGGEFPLFGYGMAVEEGSQVHVERIFIENAAANGVFVATDASLTGTDVRVSNTASSPSTLRSGRGIEASRGAHVDLERVRVDASHEFALIANSDATVKMSHASLSDVEPARCVSTTCESTAFGIGAGAYTGASIALSTFEVEGAALCNVHVAFGGTVDLRDGLVARGAIGLCVETDDFDVEGATENVRFEENALSIDALDLPVPDFSSGATDALQRPTE